ncbi:hypothetical protein DKM44_11635 [Deinococcus irradiatisoli]|uniref:N-acetyltransferase domain-containing protein n=2 Tax=Deinococcus irradiatisoli TaxID=2202254 RepID=A0A2Z3JPK4_9DEIO|nr:hypothetical protein DKM44_11635 [Deinococcus irradiatisoli]
MLSIRFEGLNRDRPFVDASVLSRPLTALDFPALLQAAYEVYGAFQPLYLRLWSAASAGAFPQARPDKRFLAAPITDLRGRSVPPELSLSPTRDLSRYEQAQAAYDAVDARHPAHPQQAALQSREDLQESIEAGTLFDVQVSSEWAGYVGATQDCEGGALGLPAYVVQELIMSAPFRGRGYGAALSTLLARALPDEQHILVGTIHAENRGAIAAALRSGRVDVGGWLQLVF